MRSHWQVIGRPLLSIVVNRTQPAVGSPEWLTPMPLQGTLLTPDAPEVSMHVREATIDDLDRIVTLLADDRLGRKRENPATIEPYRRTFDAILRDPNQLLTVLDDSSHVVGTLQLSLIPYLTFQGGWRGQIEAVRIAAPQRGQGLGRVLVEWAIETARQRGCHIVQLTTNRERSEAHRFYEDLGFTPSHLGMKLYVDGDVNGRSGSERPGDQRDLR